MTQISKQNIVEATEEVFSSVLDLDIQPTSSQLVSCVAPTITGLVNISGSFVGAVTVCCSLSMAKTAAAAVFSYAPEEAPAEDVRDVMGELANMVGGSIKALLPGSCGLSLPAVVEGSDYRLVVRDSHVLSRVEFDCMDKPISVTVVERSDEKSR